MTSSEKHFKSRILNLTYKEFVPIKQIRLIMKFFFYSSLGIAARLSGIEMYTG